jgi:hypothetical protein
MSRTRVARQQKGFRWESVVVLDLSLQGKRLIDSSTGQRGPETPEW